MKRKGLIIMISSVILITSVIAVFIYFKPHRSVRSEEASFRVTVRELVDAFTKDETAANAMYVGKIMEVRGPVREIILNDSTLILLLGDTTRMTGISCYLQRNQKEKYKSLQRGDTVAVKGVCNGMLLDVVIDKGILLTNGTERQLQE